MDTTKERLVKETLIRLHPGQLTEWSMQHHGNVLPITAGAPRPAARIHPRRRRRNREDRTRRERR